MRVLIGCECSGAVRRAFRERGHDAWSVDILPAMDGSPFHYQRELVEHRLIARQKWDLGIFFPPCTFLTVSGSRLFKIPWRAQAMLWSVEFVKTIWSFPIEKKALENPVGKLSTLWQKPTQIIHPWQFGHPEAKTTCLWLDNLPRLKPTNILQKNGRWQNQTASGQNKLAPSDDRALRRSLTYPGIAKAMAEQWG